MTLSILGGFFILAIGIIMGGAATLMVEKDEKEKLKATAYAEGLKRGSKPNKSALKKAEKQGFDRGYAEAGAEMEEAIAQRLSEEAEALIAQGYEAGLAVRESEAELIGKVGKS